MLPHLVNNQEIFLPSGRISCSTTEILFYLRPYTWLRDEHNAFRKEAYWGLSDAWSKEDGALWVGPGGQSRRGGLVGEFGAVLGSIFRG